MKLDQDVFITAVILNSYLKTTPFKQSQIITNASIYGLLSWLWKHFYTTEDVPLELYEQLDEYLNNCGEFSELPVAAANIKMMAEWNQTSLDPLCLYNNISIAGDTPTLLVRLACRLLAICPNSASCERLFSTFGLILTKFRNCLGTQNLLDLAELKMHICDKHVRNKTKEKIHKRGFGVHVEAHNHMSDQSNAQAATPVTTISQYLMSDDNDADNPPAGTTSMCSLKKMTASLVSLVDEAADNDHNGSQSSKIII
jgi:hypothetical protein